LDTGVDYGWEREDTQGMEEACEVLFEAGADYVWSEGYELNSLAVGVWFF